MSAFCLHLLLYLLEFISFDRPYHSTIINLPKRNSIYCFRSNKESGFGVCVFESNEISCISFHFGNLSKRRYENRRSKGDRNIYPFANNGSISNSHNVSSIRIFTHQRFSFHHMYWLRGGLRIEWWGALLINWIAFTYTHTHTNMWMIAGVSRDKEGYICLCKK